MSSAAMDIKGSQFIWTSKAVAITFASDQDSPLAASETDAAQPVTVLPVNEERQISAQWIVETVDRMLSKDDVFNRGFLKTVFFHVPAGVLPTMTEDARSLFATWGTASHFVHCESRLPNAPYFFSKSKLFEAFRIFPDPQEAFVFGLLPPGAEDGRFQKAHLPGIPVPSRLYYDEASPSRPLSGKRIAVKDVFDIRGVETSASCRDYASFYGPANQTAKSVTTLLDQGAVLVGKTKTAQFAAGEDPMDWVDYKCPFNPRGDGTLSPYGSSSGSAAGLAAYEWLDFSIGTDTLGSVIAPAAGQGLFGIRPTHGLLPTDGITKVCQWFDVPGYFAKDLHEFETFGKAWYGTDHDDSLEAFPKKILYAPERFDSYPSSKLDVMQSFIRDLEEAAQVERSNFDVSKTWDDTSVSAIKTNIQDYLATTLAYIQLKSHYQNGVQFRTAFKEARDRDPYINPMVRWKWKYGESLSDDEYRQACAERETFKKFVIEHVFKDGEVMVLPGGGPDEMYYDEYFGSPEEKGKDLQGFGFEKNNVYSVLAGLPMIAIPIGQRRIQSKTTGAFMNEPVCITLVGPPGSDFRMMKFIQKAMQMSGRTVSVKTGPDCF